MEGLPSTQFKTATNLRRSIEGFEALGLDWGTAVIATAQRHGVRLMDVIVAAPRAQTEEVNK